MNAVKAVVDCFEGQPNKKSIQYQIDPGISKNAQQMMDLEDHSIGFKNEDIVVDALKNVQKVQQEKKS